MKRNTVFYNDDTSLLTYRTCGGYRHNFVGTPLLPLSPAVSPPPQFALQPPLFPRNAGLPTRDGRALTYSVEYDDGDKEKVVRRGHIAPFPEEVWEC